MILSVGGLWITRRHVAGFFLFLMLGCAAAGGLVAAIHMQFAPAALLTRPLSYTEIAGTITAIEPRGESGRRARITIAPSRIDGLAATRFDWLVRVTITGGDGLRIGDGIVANARLFPLSAPNVPGDPDFSRGLYFDGIGATGFVFGHRYRVVEPAPTGMTAVLDGGLSRLRQAIMARISASLPAPQAAIAKALIVGERGQISPQTAEDLRRSGLAHLLAISGLHMGLLCGTVFFAVRFLLALVPALALRFAIKKWAAVAAMLAGLLYLGISGATVPTQRAFASLLFVWLAILIDRRAISLRLVAVAAIIVLCLRPDAVLGPSFQLSFAAVTVLVAFYDGPGRRWFEGGQGSDDANRHPKTHQSGHDRRRARIWQMRRSRLAARYAMPRTAQMQTNPANTPHITPAIVPDARAGMRADGAAGAEDAGEDIGRGTGGNGGFNTGAEGTSASASMSTSTTVAAMEADSKTASTGKSGAGGVGPGFATHAGRAGKWPPVQIGRWFWTIAYLIGEISELLWRPAGRVLMAIPGRAPVFFAGLLVTGVLVTLVTSPIIAVHFGRISMIGILSNLVAIPVMAFWVMPLIVLALALMPLGLAGPVFWAMGPGLGLLLDVAKTAAAQEWGLWYLADPGVIGACGVICALIWLLIWRRSLLSWFAGVPLMIGLVGQLAHIPADILIGGDQKSWAVYDRAADRLVMSDGLSRFQKSLWLTRFGIRPEDADAKTEICKSAICNIDVAGKHIVISAQFENSYRACAQGDIVVSLRKDFLRKACAGKASPTMIIDDDVLWWQGGVAIGNIDAPRPQQITAAQSSGKWPWIILGGRSATKAD